MPAVTRLGLVPVLLIAALVALSGAAAAGLWVAGHGTLALLVAVTGAGAAVSGLVLWAIGRRKEEQPPLEAPRGPAGEEPLNTLPQSLPAAPAVRRPLRVQSMPVADLPPEYLEAVRRGTRAWNDAWKRREQPGEQPHQH